MADQLRGAQGQIASIAEIMAAVKEWYAAHPDFLMQHAGGKPTGDDAKLRAFHAANGWTGWRGGPKLLTDCPLYGWDGWLPAHTHGWYSTMQEYDGEPACFPYEAGYSLGYKVNVQLRPGERLVRNWSNRGLYVNMDGTAGQPGALTGKIGQDFMTYCPKFGDLAPGRIGNGTIDYQVPLDAGLEQMPGGSRTCKRRAENSCAAEASRPGILEIRNPTSYVYLNGEATLTASLSGGHIGVYFSDNNGLDWRELPRINRSGREKIELGKLILRRYDYRLRLVLEGAGTEVTAARLPPRHPTFAAAAARTGRRRQHHQLFRRSAGRLCHHRGRVGHGRQGPATALHRFPPNHAEHPVGGPLDDRPDEARRRDFLHGPDAR